MIQKKASKSAEKMKKIRSFVNAELFMGPKKRQKNNTY